MVSAEEQARRVRAAVAYSGRTEAAIAGEIGVGVRTLGRWKEIGLPDEGDPRKVKALTDACGLPYTWFTADFTMLWRIPASPADGFTGEAGEAS